MINWQAITQHIQETTNQPFVLRNKYSIGGGCINQAYHLEGETQDYFIKLNQSHYSDMFEAEVAGLTALAQSKTLRVPLPLCCGKTETHSYLVMEYLSLNGKNNRSSQLLGEQLAMMHQTTQAQFGWYRDNYIGSTAQINTLDNDWGNFWQQHRLGFQLALAARHGYMGQLQRDGERLLADLHAFFTNYHPKPALLHGDLWSGNYATDEQGQVVIFDPAIYYGDREADIAMTELFGGFGHDFYAAYNKTSALDVGYQTRKTLYNLYHILNHLNLFGGGYLAQSERMISQLLSELY